MKVVILAGGFGTRIGEYTNEIPKPMIRIGDKPIIEHIMRRFARFGHKDFYLALGYKSEVIKQYFLNFSTINSDFSVNLRSGSINHLSEKLFDWNVNLIDTGMNSMTGGRIRRLKEFVGNERFLCTYGDGLSNVDIDSLINLHDQSNCIATVTAVRPNARFGELQIKENVVTSFKEKPQLDQGWINGGFFVFEPQFFDYIDGDNTVLEKEPLENVAQEGKLAAYLHNGFWQCMDTRRDHEHLSKIYTSGDIPWEK